MNDAHEITVREEPDLDPAELWDFYVEGECCEVRYGPQRAPSVLAKSDVVVTARNAGKLVGVARAITDGIDACIMELSLLPSHQGPGCVHEIAPLIEDDARGVGKRLAETLVHALLARGICFIERSSAYRTELPFYESAGFAPNTGHTPMYIDRRPPLP